MGCKIGIAVCSNRPDDLAHFMQVWTPKIQASKNTIRFFLHEDGPSRSSLPYSEFLGSHTDWGDTTLRLKDEVWIIPRGTGAGRSFPMYLAWRAGCEYIITMDDDCFPAEGQSDFFDAHLSAFRMDRWFRTITGEEPRGIPYGDRGSLPVLLNHGLWTGTPDLDGPTSLVRQRVPIQVGLKDRQVVPPGMPMTLCGMNVCYHRSAIPAAYNLLMGTDAYGLDRFDDIWSGLFLKKVADAMGMYITSGPPYIYHSKASDPFSNMRKEALGMQIHEGFWKYVQAFNPPGKLSISEAYVLLAGHVAQYPDSRYPFKALASAMMAWVLLFA